MLSLNAVSCLAPGTGEDTTGSSSLAGGSVTYAEHSIALHCANPPILLLRIAIVVIFRSAIPLISTQRKPKCRSPECESELLRLRIDIITAMHTSQRGIGKVLCCAPAQCRDGCFPFLRPPSSFGVHLSKASQHYAPYESKGLSMRVRDGGLHTFRGSSCCFAWDIDDLIRSWRGKKPHSVRSRIGLMLMLGTAQNPHIWNRSNSDERFGFECEIDEFHFDTPSGMTSGAESLASSERT